jgi:hypothetical protein
VITTNAGIDEWAGILRGSISLVDSQAIGTTAWLVSSAIASHVACGFISKGTRGLYLVSADYRKHVRD